MDRVLINISKVIRDFALKSSEQCLTEYEMLMYEQACQTYKHHCRAYELMIRKQACEIERDVVSEESEHRQWMEAQDKKEDPKE